jgi:phosphatidate cytidylyltransferase
MRSRLLTALFLSVLLIVALLYGNALVKATDLGLFVIGGAWEWAAFCGAERATGRLAYMLLILLLALSARLMLWTDAAFQSLLSVTVAGWMIALLWLVLAPQRVNRWSAGAAGILALVPTWLALLRIATEWPRGAQWALFILVLAFAMDTGGFFVGRKFGRLKLAPHISPGKTWEGVIGGLLLALPLAWLGARWFGLDPRTFVPLCMAAAMLAVAGDLMESMLKRASGMKDSGRLFPGHGGVLDRIDSVTAATPVMALGLIWLGAGS